MCGDKTLKTLCQAYKYELDPTNEQIVSFRKHIDLKRLIYNRGIDAMWARVKTDKKLYSTFDLQKEYRQWRDGGDVKDMEKGHVSASVANFTCQHLVQAFMNFWKAKKKGDKRVRPPVRKSRKDTKSYTVQISEGGQDLRSGNQEWIKLPIVGRVRTKERLRVRGKISSGTISTSGGRWFVSFLVQRNIGDGQEERRIYPIDERKPIIGIDMGLSSFITSSTGEKIRKPEHWHFLHRRIARLQKRNSRKKRRSQNQKKHYLQLSCEWKKLDDQKNDYFHKLASWLVENHQAIGIESLNVVGMMQQKNLASSFQKSSIARFLSMLKYKAEWYGCMIVEVDQFFPSTKRCSWCGNVKDQMVLSERRYFCQECGYENDRDVNAAINLKQEAKKAVDAKLGRDTPKDKPVESVARKVPR